MASAAIARASSSVSPSVTSPGHGPGGVILGLSKTYTAVTKPSAAWWIGWIEEIPWV